MNTLAVWGLLVLAGVFEVAWAVGLKYTQGFTRLGPSIATLAAILTSMGLLGIAARTLPIGTAYAVWTGIGVIGTAVFGIWLFDEPSQPVRLVCLGLIAAGIIGLRLSGT